MKSFGFIRCVFSKGKHCLKKTQLASVPGISWRWEDRRRPICTTCWHPSCVNRGYNLAHSFCIQFSTEPGESQQSDRARTGDGSSLSAKLLTSEILRSGGAAAMPKQLTRYCASWNAAPSRCDLKQKLVKFMDENFHGPHINHQVSYLSTNPSAINCVNKLWSATQIAVMSCR